jgi:hypothetical protein
MRPAVSFEEALPRPQPAVDRPVPLAERLQLCSRLLAVAADELDALERGDLAKRRHLAEEREALVLELQPRSRAEADDDDGPEEEDGLNLPLAQQIARIIAEAVDQLEEREEEERRMQDRWSSLEGDALKAVHVGGKIASVRRGRYPNQPHSEARLDLRF